MMIQCWFDVGPASMTMDKHRLNALSQRRLFAEKSILVKRLLWSLASFHKKTLLDLLWSVESD